MFITPIPNGENKASPHPARIYAYLLGEEKVCYGVDREAAEQVIKAAPQAVPSARANREWVHRAVRHLVQETDVRQFLDIGAGIPVEPNVHQVVQDIDPRCRVVYVDNDSVVLAHSRALTISTPEGRTNYLLADMHKPETILDRPEVRKTLDLDRPVALVLAAVLHFVPDLDEAVGIVAALRDALPPGSYLVLSHATGDFSEAAAHAAAEVYEASGAATMTLRSREEVITFFDGCELVEPGVVQVSFWRPDGPFDAGTARRSWARHDAVVARQALVYGGVGRIVGSSATAGGAS